jgi:hypothetical protein
VLIGWFQVLTLVGSLAIVPVVQLDTGALTVHVCALLSPMFAFAVSMDVTARAEAAGVGIHFGEFTECLLNVHCMFTERSLHVH